jgi:phage tail-like protein
VDVRQRAPGFTLRILVPAGMVIDDYRHVNGSLLPEFEIAEIAPEQKWQTPNRIHYLVWREPEAQQPGASHEYEVKAKIEQFYVDKVLESQAWVLSGTGSNAPIVDSETASVSLQAKGSYLQFLPALYEQDDFMGRFLMLFESFWAPVEAQIGNFYHYFDPKMTPARFLPWLAAWFNLSLDERWSEAQQRRLLASIARLYRKRGARQGLQEYLEIFTGHPVEIGERRAKDFRLGKGARLGAGVALGTGNVPHTFTVRVRLEPLRPTTDDGKKLSKEELERLEQRRRRAIESIIESEKPAHTSYTLEIMV